MRCRTYLIVSIGLLFFAGSLRGAEPKAEELKESPAGLSPQITASLNPTGYRISGKDGVVCDLWLAKDVPMVAGFKPTLQVKYPFTPGQLMGAIRFPEKSSPGDF